MPEKFEKKVLWLHVRLTIRELTQVRAICAKRGISISQVARRALKTLLDRQERGA